MFSYTPVHDVVEVNQQGYNTCMIANAIATYDTGDTMIHLDRPGTRYFICGRMGHCQQGLKLQVQVLAQSNNNGTNDDQNQRSNGTVVGSTSSPPRDPPPAFSPPQDDVPLAEGPCDCSHAEEGHGLVSLITLVIIITSFSHAPFLFMFLHL